MLPSMVARSEDELLFVVTILCPVQPDPFERYNELLLLAYANWPSLVAVAGKADVEAYLDIPTDSDNCSLTQLVPFHFTISPAVAEVTVTLLRSPKLPAVFLFGISVIYAVSLNPLIVNPVLFTLYPAGFIFNASRTFDVFPGIIGNY